MSFRPYGSEEVRVISDTSRFRYELGKRKATSRNVSPNSQDDHSSQITFGSILPTESRNRNVSSRYRDQDAAFDGRGIKDKQLPPKPIDFEDIYSYYKGSRTITSKISEGSIDEPFPESISDRRENVVDLPYNNSHPLNIPRISADMVSTTLQKNDAIEKNDLPSLKQPKDYYMEYTLQLANSDTLSVSTRKKQLEQDLIRQVMNKPLFKIQTKNFVWADKLDEKEIVISYHIILYLIEVIFEVIVISLSSALLKKDGSVSKAMYRYFVASGTVSLIVSFLFISTIINFEKRNGSFYCLAAALLMTTAFILVTAVLLPMKCSNGTICSMRKAVGAFIILSTFLWVGNLVIFLTTLYISRLNLLHDINFDYSDEGLDKEYNHLAAGSGNLQDNDLKRYFLNEHGEMYEINDSMDLKNRNKIIVYTS
ncbi:uncharacterized protein PRCAT00002056001 [Priceomyces carsonii]|uniref:uncharacterized protein n=1 Tax=Priceomyces carsonii TaxID=28549 RepID=UPI002ED8275D|nr:unnamed protein product [Priceomyces carsonii]